MAVSFDNKNHVATGVAATSASFTLAIGAGVTNGAVLVLLSFYANTATNIAVKVGGVSASLIANTNIVSSNNVVRSLVYGIATGPTTGNVTVACTWTGATSLVMGAMSFSGVNQITPFANGNHATGTTTPATVNITSVVGDYTASCVSGENNNTISAANHIQEYIANDTSFDIQGAGQIATGTSSVTHSWMATSSWTISGVDVQAASQTIFIPVEDFWKLPLPAPDYPDTSVF